jgi:hypothetical protein
LILGQPPPPACVACMARRGPRDFFPIIFWLIFPTVKKLVFSIPGLPEVVKWTSKWWQNCPEMETPINRNLFFSKQCRCTFSTVITVRSCMSGPLQRRPNRPNFTSKTCSDKGGLKNLKKIEKIGPRTKKTPKMDPPRGEGGGSNEPGWAIKKLSRVPLGPPGAPQTCQNKIFQNFASIGARFLSILTDLASIFYQFVFKIGSTLYTNPVVFCS